MSNSMSAQHAPGPWMWTPQQWAEIVRCAKESTAYRGAAKVDRALKRQGICDSVADPYLWEKRARHVEARIHELLRCWVPEARAAIAKATGSAS